MHAHSTALNALRAAATQRAEPAVAHTTADNAFATKLQQHYDAGISTNPLHFEVGNVTDIAAQRIAKLDTDGDGAVNLATEAPKQHSVLSAADKAGNGDGIVTKAELTSYVHSFDADSNGVLSSSERATLLATARNVAAPSGDPTVAGFAAGAAASQLNGDATRSGYGATHSNAATAALDHELHHAHHTHHASLNTAHQLAVQLNLEGLGNKRAR